MDDQLSEATKAKLKRMRDLHAIARDIYAEATRVRDDEHEHMMKRTELWAGQSTQAERHVFDEKTKEFGKRRDEIRERRRLVLADVNTVWEELQLAISADLGLPNPFNWFDNVPEFDGSRWL